MIGQKKLQQDIDRLFSDFPRFSIITGPSGSGKKTISKLITDKFNYPVVKVSNKIDDVRNMIDLAYKQTEPIFFAMHDADSMSLGAKNSLLKITEEPPRNCYFIMTLISLDNSLETIKSRGTVFALNPYTKEELLQYRLYRGYGSTNDDIISRMCTTTGEVDLLFSYNVDELYSFCSNVVANIHIPKNGNAFKITGYLKMKESDEGYDAKLCLKIISELFKEKGLQTKKKAYMKASLTTCETIRKLQNAVVSKQSILDMWIINVRRDLVEI